jgi:probable rRNA maturation factor
MILIADLQDAIPLPLAKLKRLAQRVIARETLGPGNLSVAFVDRATMRRVNRRFLKHDFDTDVLAFPLDGDLIGEIVISPEYARGEAKRRGLPVAEEIARYLVHGILHLAGYDDHDPKAKAKMWKRQESYLK